MSTASGPESEAELRDLRLQLTGAMAELTDRERAVFILREVEGLTTIEVARALGIARVTVRRHLNLARKRLRVALGGNDEP